MLYPLLWMISASFKDTLEIFQGTDFFPKSFRLDNYMQGWQGLSGVTFTRFYINSFIIVIAAMVGNLTSCLMAANAFAKKMCIRDSYYTIGMPFHNTEI